MGSSFFASCALRPFTGVVFAGALKVPDSGRGRADSEVMYSVRRKKLIFSVPNFVLPSSERGRKRTLSFGLTGGGFRGAWIAENSDSD